MLKHFPQNSLPVPDHHLTASAGVSENAVTSPVNAKKRMSLLSPLASSLWTQVQGYGLDAEEYFRMAFTRMSRYARMINDRLTVTLADGGGNFVVTFDAHRPSRHAVMYRKAAIIDGLHMTARNLHRKLHKENTSFKLLLNEVRQELAEHCSRDRSITLTEMSL